MKSFIEQTNLVNELLSINSFLIYLLEYYKSLIVMYSALPKDFPTYPILYNISQFKEKVIQTSLKKFYSANLRENIIKFLQINETLILADTIKNKEQVNLMKEIYKCFIKAFSLSEFALSVYSIFGIDKTKNLIEINQVNDIKEFLANSYQNLFPSDYGKVNPKGEAEIKDKKAFLQQALFNFQPDCLDFRHFYFCICRLFFFLHYGNFEVFRPAPKI